MWLRRDVWTLFKLHNLFYGRQMWRPRVWNWYAGLADGGGFFGVHMPDMHSFHRVRDEVKNFAAR